jgi:hypothetical protein
MACVLMRLLVTATGRWSIYRWSWQFSNSQALDEGHVPFFGAFGAAWDERIVARWSAPRMLWPEMDAAFVTSGKAAGTPTAGDALVCPIPQLA